jgi:hypothetical protein
MTATAIMTTITTNITSFNNINDNDYDNGTLLILMEERTLWCLRTGC